MQCPYCLFHFHDDENKFQYNPIGNDHGTQWYVKTINCARCGKLIVFLQEGERYPFMVLPKSVSRASLGPEVEAPYSSDYLEACAVLADSPKASAALSRRTLQLLLRNVAKVRPADLSKEIQEVLESRSLPSHLADAIDAVRNIGNLAAHPIKSTHFCSL